MMSLQPQITGSGNSPAEERLNLPAFYMRLGEVHQGRMASAWEKYLNATAGAARAWTETGVPATPLDFWRDATTYASDFVQRSFMFWDTLRQRGDNWLQHEEAGKPPLLAFETEMIADGRQFERPVNYALVRIVPPKGIKVDDGKRPYVIIDPRAGHGPGIGGFKDESQVGVALKAGHPVYFVIFFPEPVEGQTLADVSQAETEFLRIVRKRHPTRGKPVIVGNCQGGWAAMLVGAVDPEAAGPIVVNGAPMSYWAGNDAENPMRYAGGILGGSWTALLASDLGGGRFDGAYLVDNFEYLNPANTYFSKYYNLFSKIDTEPERFLEFERWWGGYFLMNREEISWIVDNLFVGNRLAAGQAQWSEGKAYDLRAIRSPIILFASLGDNITPPQQAFSWVADIYPTTEALKANGQVIVGLMHKSIGHLGIFVSASVAKKEHAQIVDLLEYIEHLPPGLYGMQVEERQANGVAQYDVIINERQVEDLQVLYKYGRRDEVPFELVAKVSEANEALYETCAHPVISAAVTPAMAKLARNLHPLRMQRWAVSDLNPIVAPVKGLAEFAKASRTVRDEHGPSVAAERWAAANITAGWDLYRQLRDATMENLFYHVYGSASVVTRELGSRPEPVPEALPAARDTPEIREALEHMSEGGFTAAAVRVALLAARAGNPQRRLSRFKQIRELVGSEVGLLDLPADEARRIIRQQTHIVDYEPELARATLPNLVATPEDAERLVGMFDRLVGKVELDAAQVEFLQTLRSLLAAKPAQSAKEIAA